MSVTSTDRLDPLGDAERVRAPQRASRRCGAFGAAPQTMPSGVLSRDRVTESRDRVTEISEVLSEGLRPAQGLLVQWARVIR
jgi:hypothetical protein